MVITDGDYLETKEHTGGSGYSTQPTWMTPCRGDATPSSADAHRSGTRVPRTGIEWILPPQNTETHMRQLKILEHISLDGVIQHSADDGDFPYGESSSSRVAPR